MAALYPWQGKPNAGRAHPSCRPGHAWTFSAASLPAPTVAAAPASRNVGYECTQEPRRPPRRMQPQWRSPQLGSGWSPGPLPWHLKLELSCLPVSVTKTFDGWRSEPPLAHNLLLFALSAIDLVQVSRGGQLHGHSHRHRSRISSDVANAAGHNLAANNKWRTRKKGSGLPS